MHTCIICMGTMFIPVPVEAKDSIRIPGTGVTVVKHLLQWLRPNPGLGQEQQVFSLLSSPFCPHSVF